MQESLTAGPSLVGPCRTEDQSEIKMFLKQIFDNCKTPAGPLRQIVTVHTKEAQSGSLKFLSAAGRAACI